MRRCISVSIDNFLSGVRFFPVSISTSAISSAFKLDLSSPDGVISITEPTRILKLPPVLVVRPLSYERPINKATCSFCSFICMEIFYHTKKHTSIDIISTVASNICFPEDRYFFTTKNFRKLSKKGHKASLPYTLFL